MEKQRTYQRPSFFEGVTRAMREEMEKKKKEPGALLCDLAVLAIAMFFARRHIIFGAYPLAPALVAVLPSRVWPALIGAVVGALTMGGAGIIHVIILVIVVFLRIIISGGSRASEDSPIFSEPLIMRVAAVTLASFVGAAYEMLLRGFNISTATFGACAVLLSVAFCLLYSGLFGTGVGVGEIFFGTGAVFSRTKGSVERNRILFFEISALVFVFLVPFSLSDYDFFGITPAYAVCTVVTLFVAKRFGAGRAMAVGFASALGISSVQAVSFALAGAAAGLLFGFGAWYAIFGGGALLVAWSSYAGGMSGFLSVFPEYTSSSLLMLPLLKRAPKEHTVKDSDNYTRVATEMVATMASSYQISLSFGGELEECLASLSSVVRKYGEGERGVESSFSPSRMEALAKEYELTAKLINEANVAAECERAVDGEASARLAGVFSSFGFSDGVIRVFGSRHKQIICAGVDKDGSVISSCELRAAIEAAIGLRLKKPEFFRKGDVALMSCSTAPSHRVEYATASVSAEGSRVSGDTVCFFERSDAFYAVLSDGMGTGEVAKRTSLFVTEFLSRSLHPDFGESTVISSLNYAIRLRGEECSATVDAFSFDLLNGEAVFLKSGAAPSYVKREGSIFRIRSQTAPIGLMKSVDAERIRVEVKGGDVIVMLSDGISSSPEDAPWLPQLLNDKAPYDLKEYADRILSAARMHSKTGDDMTVAVIRVC